MVQTRPRGECPPLLKANRAKWTNRWHRILDGHARGDWATPLAKKLLREAVLGLTHGKCAFCEGRLEVTTWAEIEHYHPKTRYPKHAFLWTNLFPACAICNQRKGEQDHRGALLKPDDEDPERYFWVHPDNGRLDPSPGLSAEDAVRATETIRLCDLQRPVLRRQRAQLMKRLSRFLAGGDPGEGDEEIGEYLDPGHEYKLVIRHVFEQKGYLELAQEDRRRFQE
jgi:uncharacterized protein (TIGR02646 family)